MTDAALADSYQHFLRPFARTVATGQPPHHDGLIANEEDNDDDDEMTTAARRQHQKATPLLTAEQQQQQQLGERAFPPTPKPSTCAIETIPDTIVRLNVGGVAYRLRTRSIVKRGPHTLLGRFVRMPHEQRLAFADAFFDESSEYFFERVPRLFDPIYDFYATGQLHVPKDVCFDRWMSELRYWALSKDTIEDCCSPFAAYTITSDHDDVKAANFDSLCCGRFRQHVWMVLEGHAEGRWWSIFEFISTTFVLLSVAVLILGSIPELQVPQETTRLSFSYATAMYPTYPGSGQKVSVNGVFTDPARAPDAHPELVEHPIFMWVENVCVTFFTIEYLLRFIVAPRKLAFARQFLNVIDLLSIAPFFAELLIELIGIDGKNIRKVRWAFLTVRLLRVLRVIRIVKLGRFSPGLTNFARTLHKSMKQLQMVGVVILTVIVFFSTLIYFLEKDEPNSKFTSIPTACWFSLITMSTVSLQQLSNPKFLYAGEIIVQSLAGKMVSSLSIISGIMTFALPITIIVNNFIQVVKLREGEIIKKYAQQPDRRE